MTAVPQAWYIGGASNAPLLEKVFGESLLRLDALPLEVAGTPALLVLDLSNPAAMEGLVQLQEDPESCSCPIALLSSRRLGG